MPIKEGNEQKVHYTGSLQRYSVVLRKQFLLAVFMDIQGAFDSTSFEAIHEALESRDVDGTVIR